MQRRSFFTLSALAVSLAALAIIVLQCSDSKNSTGSGGGGGGTTLEFDSSLPGGVFTHVFDKVGSFPYHCRNHGGSGGAGMSGTITVIAAGTPNTLDVNVKCCVFTPSNLTVEVGDTVRWSGMTATHTVTSDN